MLINKETKQCVFVISKLPNGDMVTGDGVIFSEKYTLIYEIPGHKPVSISFSGEELLSSAQRYLNSSINGCTYETLCYLSNDLNIPLTLWATSKISNSLYKNISKNYQRQERTLIKRNKNKINKKNNDLRVQIATYFYLKFVIRDQNISTKKILHITDCCLDESSINLLKNNWKEQRITKMLNLKTFDEFIKRASFGTLTNEWYKDLDAYNKAA